MLTCGLKQLKHSRTVNSEGNKDESVNFGSTIWIFEASKCDVSISFLYVLYMYTI